MANITPAIISNNFFDIKNRIDRLDGLTPWVHLDVKDGDFTSPATWSEPNQLKEITGRIKIEAHLMIAKPEESLSLWRDIIDRITIHFEATDQLAQIIDDFSHSAVELGVALELKTPVEKIFSYVKKVSVVQLMSIAQIGFGGQPFDYQVLPKIQILRKTFPDVTIQVDGGINLETGKQALAAGANILVANSAIWESTDPAKTIAAFQSL